MAITPTGIMSVPVDKLRNLIKDSSTFRTWTGSATAAIAKDRVYPFAKPRSGVVWPHCVVGWQPRGLRTAVPLREYLEGIVLYLTFEALISVDDEPNSTYTLTNNMGPIIQEMWINSADGTEDRMDLRSITLSDGPSWENEDLRAGEGEIMWCRFIVEAVTP